jgi:hypothetical protein
MINLGAHSLSSPAKMANYGEQRLTRLFNALGFKAVQEYHAGHDITVVDKRTGEKHKIEVKTARPAKDGRYHATLVKNGRTDAYKSDYVIFLLVVPFTGGQAFPFIFKTSELTARQITIPGNFFAYARKNLQHSQNFNAWHKLPFMVA